MAESDDARRQSKSAYLVGAIAVTMFAVFLYSYHWHLWTLCGMGFPHYE